MGSRERERARARARWGFEGWMDIIGRKAFAGGYDVMNGFDIAVFPRCTGRLR